jgi:uncharacterized protein
VSSLVQPDMLIWFGLAILLAATIYASVGHGGASAYLALMALFSVAPDAMRPAALVLNICVTLIGATRYVRSGQFQFQVFWPFALTAVPVAFFAGRMKLPPEVYAPLLGFALLLAGMRYLIWPQLDGSKAISTPKVWVALPAGALLGLLAGLTGTGGGIFLSPLLVFMGWASARTATGIAALFILVNSIAGLAGRLSVVNHLPSDLPILIAIVGLGAFIGTQLNLKHFSTSALLRGLGLVILIAAAPLLTGI